MKNGLLLLFSLAAFSPAYAHITLPALISDNMVLQASRAEIWGSAEPGEAVTVAFRDAVAKTSADRDGKWRVKLDGLKAGDTGDLTVSGGNTRTVKNVAVGDVWVCAGQSNMEMHVKGSAWTPQGGVLNFEQEIAEADYPQIRMFTVQKKSSETPLPEVGGKWEVCTPETVPGWSATGYFFGRKLHQDLHIPVGLIHAAWGGSNAHTWTPTETLRGDPILKAAYYDPRQEELANFPALKERHEKETLPAWRTACEAAKAQGKPLPPQPKGPIGPGWCDTASALYNGMIFGLTKCPVKGIAWYQGETNGRNAAESGRYARLLPAMIAAWRSAWGRDDLPFHLVQISNFRTRNSEPSDSCWAEVREVQRRTAGALPYSGLTVTIDIGEEKSVHPVNKQEVGRRLALEVEARVYGRDAAASGPAFETAAFEGSRVTVTFHPGTAAGLATKDGAKIKGFALAGADKRFFRAEAQIENSQPRGPVIVLNAPQVPEPVAVRYAWADNPEVNLVNAAGLPAGPFRTDDWPQAELETAPR